MSKLSPRKSTDQASKLNGTSLGGYSYSLSDAEFNSFRELIFASAGIQLSTAKKALVAGRLAKRLKALGLSRYGEYYSYIERPAGSDALLERQTAVNLLTTNETYFFREPKHFDFIREQVLPQWQTGLRRAWSAASSTGEEAYTLAMVMKLHGPNNNWEIVGTDINTDVVEIARRGQYPIERSKNIPREYLQRYCLKGVGSQSGTFLMDRSIRQKVRFTSANLLQSLDAVGQLDLILLRNVMIYFDLDTKRQVVANVVKQLKPGGYLIVGHSESLNGVSTEVEQVQPTVYKKPIS